MCAMCKYLRKTQQGILFGLPSKRFHRDRHGTGVTLRNGEGLQMPTVSLVGIGPGGQQDPLRISGKRNIELGQGVGEPFAASFDIGFLSSPTAIKSGMPFRGSEFAQGLPLGRGKKTFRNFIGLDAGAERFHVDADRMSAGKSERCLTVGVRNVEGNLLRGISKKRFAMGGVGEANFLRRNC